MPFKESKEDTGKINRPLNASTESVTAEQIFEQIPIDGSRQTVLFYCFAEPNSIQ
jgi:hypothetical protein